MCTYIYIYIYIQREREREREMNYKNFENNNFRQDLKRVIKV